MEVAHPFSLLLNSPYRDWDTEMFFSIHWNEIKQSSDPEKVLKSNPLEVMQLSKSKTDVQHEFLINEVRDRGQIKKLVLERTVCLQTGNDLDESTIIRFMGHPDSKKVLEAVKQSLQQSLRSIPQPVLVASAAVLPVVAPVLSTPLATSAFIPMPAVASALLPSSSRDLFLVEEGRNTPPSHLGRTLSSTIIPRYSITDQATMTIAQVLQSMIDSPAGRLVSDSLNKPIPPKDARANDRFVGSDLAFTERIDLTSFRPRFLTLFHVALLSDVVHMECPLYALFRDQCYWYASNVYYAAQIIDRDLAFEHHFRNRDLPDFDEDKMDNFFMPLHLYHSEHAGCWKGIRISGSKRVVLSSIIDKFYERLDYHLAEVRFYFRNHFNLPISIRLLR